MGEVMRMQETPGRLGKRIDDAYDRCEQDFKAGVEHTMELAFAVLAGRESCGGNDTKFGEWLAENTRNRIPKNTRHALLGMARNCDLARAALTATNRKSIELIWLKEVSPKIPFRTLGQAKNQTKTKTSVGSKPKSNPTCPEDLAAIYRHGNTRTLVARLVSGKGAAAKEALALIRQAKDDGFLTETNTHLSRPDLRLLFPSTPQEFASRYSLGADQENLTRIRKIMPIALEHRAELIAAPDQLPRFVREHDERQAVIAKKERDMAKIAAARKASPSEHPDVILFGKTYWPNSSPFKYDYGQLAVSYWFFKELYGLADAATSDKRSCAVAIKHTVKWLHGHTDEAIIDLVYNLTGAMEVDPKGECSPPIRPTLNIA